MSTHTDDLSWYEDAECKGKDGNLFYPERGGDVKEALKICGQCPVRLACLDYALRERINHGIWGGTSERQRRKMRRLNQIPQRDHRQPIPHGTERGLAAHGRHGIPACQACKDAHARAVQGRKAAV